MATKVELEAELESLRSQNDLLRTQAEQTRDAVASEDSADQADVLDDLKRALNENGFDGDSVEALRTQFTEEFTRMQKEYPLATLLGVFALGCVVGRAFK